MKPINNIDLFINYLSGEDGVLLQNNKRTTPFVLKIVGLVVLGLLILTFYSLYIFVNTIIEHVFLAVFLAGVFTFIFSQLYIFILYTLTPKLLPNKENLSPYFKFFKYFTWLYPATWLRIFLVGLFSFLIAQPLIHRTFSGSVLNALQDYKKIELAQFILDIDSASVNRQSKDFVAYDTTFKYKAFDSLQFSRIQSKVKNDALVLKQGLEANALYKRAQSKSEEKFNSNTLLYAASEIQLSDYEFLNDTVFKNLKFTPYQKMDSLYFNQFKFEVNKRIKNAEIGQTAISKNTYYFKVLKLIYQELFVAVVFLVGCMSLFFVPLLLKMCLRWASFYFLRRKFPDNPHIQTICTEVKSRRYTTDILLNAIQQLEIVDFEHTNYYFQKFVIEFSLYQSDINNTKKWKSDILNQFIEKMYQQPYDSAAWQMIQKYNPELYRLLTEELRARKILN